MEQIREDATKALAKIEKIDFNKLVNAITDAGDIGQATGR